MQPSSPDNLSSLSATSPTNDTTTKNFHDATKPFTIPSALPKPAKKPINSKANEAHIQAAKRELRSKLREDWDWPPTSPNTIASNIPPSHTDWRERDSDSSYPPPSPSPSPSPAPEADPYRFDTPDSVAQPVLSRKRKRQQMLEEEMTWNEGLRTYIERRDAWSAARTTTSHTPSPESKTQVPLAPPLLPTRASILPATYSTLYTKIILQSTTPNIPINLSTVVSALVQGWKKDGEWPPKGEGVGVNGGGGGGGGGGGTGGGEGRKKVRRSVGRVRRALGLGVGVDGVGLGEE
ncbi:hypothetical protein N7G274_010836 [Stereocaulon virgatum]|uniref:Gag1-like clamp domain-containing protein n=1 Tax=Stereocaulon virgatum TaxID=373712 RepID=A0ABR3ZUS9_9LECA